MARRKKREPAESAWILTYSDMVTNLLCFFVLLYSFASIDAAKFKSVSISMSRAFGGGENGVFDSSDSGNMPMEGSPEYAGTANEKMYEKVLKYMQDNKMEAKVQIRQESRGVVIELKENVLFESGKVDLIPESIPILKKVAGLLNKFPNDVIVEGHTDNLPIRSGYYQSNWELSTDRAVKVVRYFTDTEKLEGKRFTAVGCGEYKPIDTNDTNEGRKNNRRVNILIVTPDKESGDK